MAVEWDGWVVRDGGVPGGTMLLKFRPIKVKKLGNMIFHGYITLQITKCSVCMGYDFASNDGLECTTQTTSCAKSRCPLAPQAANRHRPLVNGRFNERWRSLCKKRHRPLDPWR